MKDFHFFVNLDVCAIFIVFVHSAYGCVWGFLELAKHEIIDD